MILLQLFYNFIIVGLFSFGGAYSAIPLIKDAANNFVAIDVEMLANFIAISESTPGPVGVNLATFVGAKVFGPVGAIVATVAEILPAFVIILVISLFMKGFIEKKEVKFVLSVIRPAVIGMIFAVGLYMVYENIKSVIDDKPLLENVAIFKQIIIYFIIIFIMVVYKKITKKSISTIKVIVIGAILGIAINLIL